MGVQGSAGSAAARSILPLGVVGLRMHCDLLGRAVGMHASQHAVGGDEPLVSRAGNRA